ncbi:MAG: DUF5916 domain-containing protein [Gemmatimonadota bacterium]
MIGLAQAAGLSAQVADSTTAGGPPSRQEGAADRREILGPPAPIPPETVSRTEEGEVTLRASRVTGGIDVDGVLDEPFYQQTEPVSDFIQTVPVAGDEPSQRTEAWVGFDDENFYVAARIWEPRGEEGWIANEMRRDSPELRENDNFGVFIDTYYDRRNAMGFYVNPIGGFSDFQITNEGNPNFDWNPVYEIQTGRFEGGWTVEYAIPFESLRYRPGHEQVWGIQLRRSVLRRNEWNHLTYIPLSVAPNGSTGVFRVSMYGTLVGVEAPPPSRNVEIKPYGISGLRTDLTTSPGFENDGYADAGLDVKYGITRNLTADFTYNTDFAQVEVDEQQVNLTRFSLFFPEKREFFLESGGIFNFGSGPVGGGGGGPGGGGGVQAPTLFYSRQIGLQAGEPVPILGGGRVTGKVGDFDVGAVSIQTDDEPALSAESTNFTVLRLRRDVLARSSVGVLWEHRTNSATASGSNTAWGLDGSFGLTDDINVLGYYAETRTPGLTGMDASYRGRFGFGADEWGATVDHMVVGDDFNPEIGFVRRKGFRQTALSGRHSPRIESVGWLRQLRFETSVSYIENERAGFVESRDRAASFGIDFENSDAFSASYTENYENLVQDEIISGALIPAGRYSFREARAGFTFGPHRRISGGVSVRRGEYFDGDLTSLEFNQGRVAVLPQLSVEPSLSFNWIDLPQGRFDQHVAVARVTYTVTPRAYVSGLVQYNSGNDNFSTNLRLRWEWAPGSELFLVYTEARDTDVLDRWSTLENRGFVVKVTRLFRL